MHDPRLIPLKTMTSDILKVSRAPEPSLTCTGGWSRGGRDRTSYNGFSSLCKARDTGVVRGTTRAEMGGFLDYHCPPPRTIFGSLAGLCQLW